MCVCVCVCVTVRALTGQWRGELESVFDWDTTLIVPTPGSSPTTVACTRDVRRFSLLHYYSNPPPSSLSLSLSFILSVCVFLLLS